MSTEYLTKRSVTDFFLSMMNNNREPLDNSQAMSKHKRRVLLKRTLLSVES